MLNQAITFGAYRLDPQGVLMRGKRQRRLTPKAFALLCYLADQRARVVTKVELFDALWPGTAVGDAALVTGEAGMGKTTLVRAFYAPSSGMRRCG